MIRFLSCLLATTFIASAATAATITYDIAGYFEDYKKEGPHIDSIEQYTGVSGPTTFSTRIVFDVNSLDSAPNPEFGYYIPKYFELIVNNKIVSSSNNGNNAVASVSNGLLGNWGLQFNIWNSYEDLFPLIPGIEGNSFNITFDFKDGSLISDGLDNFDIYDIDQIYSSYLFSSSGHPDDKISKYSLSSNYDPKSKPDDISFITDYKVSIQSSVPEPSTWFTMIIGFGLLGLTMRKREKLQFI